MSWARIDDQFFLNPKVIVCDKDAKLLYIAGLTYSSGQLTDGVIPTEALALLGILAGVANAQASADRLLEVCLWFACDNGYSIHDYLEYNPSKEKVLSVRDARKEAGSKGGQASLGKHRVANAQANASKQNASKTQALSPTPTPSSVDKSTGATPAPSKPKLETNHGLAPIFEAFEEAGLPRPLVDGPEAKAANTLLKNDVAPAVLAECFQDVEAGKFGDGWLRDNLSFVALVSHQRIRHYLAWVDAGRPAPEPRNNGRVAAAFPLPSAEEATAGWGKDN